VKLVVLLREARRTGLGDDAQIARQALHRLEQVGARHHGVAQHLEGTELRCARRRKADGRIAGSLHRQLPEPVR